MEEIYWVDKQMLVSQERPRFVALVKRKAYMCSCQQNMTPGADDKIVGPYMEICKRKTSEFLMPMNSTTQSIPRNNPPATNYLAGMKLARYQ